MYTIAIIAPITNKTLPILACNHSIQTGIGYQLPNELFIIKMFRAAAFIPVKDYLPDGRSSSE